LIHDYSLSDSFVVLAYLYVVPAKMFEGSVLLIQVFTSCAQQYVAGSYRGFLEESVSNGASAEGSSIGEKRTDWRQAVS